MISVAQEKQFAVNQYIIIFCFKETWNSMSVLLTKFVEYWSLYGQLPTIWTYAKIDIEFSDDKKFLVVNTVYV